MYCIHLKYENDCSYKIFCVHILFCSLYFFNPFKKMANYNDQDT